MGVGNRPAACASCGKRLTYKSWYYRNGKHYCKRRCWEDDVAKAAKEAAKQKEKEKEVAAAPAPAVEKPQEAPGQAAS